MKRKLSPTFLKIGLLAAIAFSFPLIQAPTSVCFANGDDPVQDGSKSKPKQGADKKEEAKKEVTQVPIDVIIDLLIWLLT